MGPPSTPPNWLRRYVGFTGLLDAKTLRALSASLRRNSKPVPCTLLVPDFVVRLTTPPLKRPNSAGGLFVSILNSWMASMFGKNATCPGSGCSTEMPSNKYSLVRGRPPLIRGSDEFGVSATPGTSPASVMKLRPFSGNAVIVWFPMTCPRLAEALRSSAASPTTETASVTAPTVSAASSRTVSPVATCTLRRSSDRNPANSTRMLYAPGASPATR